MRKCKGLAINSYKKWFCFITICHILKHDDAIPSFSECYSLINTPIIYLG